MMRGSTQADRGSALRRKRIVLLTGNHLCHNPRVLKEATSLAQAGYEVTVLGGSVSAGLEARDRDLMRGLPFSFVSVCDATTTGFTKKLARKIASAAGRFGVETRSQLGPCYRELRRAAFACTADLYIAHSEQGMGVAAELRRAGCRVGIDMEDWFSEDLRPQARRGRPVRMLRRLEQDLLRNGAPTFCPSRAMSRALADTFACRAPTVIYNAFPLSDAQALGGAGKDRRQRLRPSIHWFSQTIGPGRGLEDLFAALPYVQYEAELHLRGTPMHGFEAWLARQVPDAWRDRVTIHPLVPNGELAARIAEHDIGFAGEMKYSRSRELTITNKILQYLTGGLAVVASDTEGQREVAEQAQGAVFIYPSGDGPTLAVRLNELLESKGRREAAKAAATAVAANFFCWERQAETLLNAVAAAVSAPNDPLGAAQHAGGRAGLVMSRSSR